MGIVYLIGAGPGAPDLLTLRAEKLLRRAEIVFYDALVNPDIVALAAGAEKIAVGKRYGRYSTAQRFINKRLIDAAGRFDTVVRLKGGDPMLFGRAQEEINALREAQVSFEVVPGITSALAASADIGISLTQRGVSRSVAFATPRVGAGEDPADWVQSAVAADTAVLYMAAGKASEVVAALLGAGRDPHTPLVVVENASLPSMRAFHTHLSDLASQIQKWGITGPAIIMLGEVYAEQRQSGTEKLSNSVALVPPQAQSK